MDISDRKQISQLQEKRQKNIRRKTRRHLIPYDKVFPPDPYGNREDTRPVEIRKKKRPNISIKWSDLKDGL